MVPPINTPVAKIKILTTNSYKNNKSYFSRSEMLQIYQQKGGKSRDSVSSKEQCHELCTSQIFPPNRNDMPVPARESERSLEKYNKNRFKRFLLKRLGVLGVLATYVLASS